MFTFYTDLIICWNCLVGDNENQQKMLLCLNMCFSVFCHVQVNQQFLAGSQRVCERTVGRKDKTMHEFKDTQQHKRTVMFRLRQELHWLCDIYYILPFVKVTTEDHRSHMNAQTSTHRVHIWYSYTHTLEGLTWVCHP